MFHGPGKRFLWPRILYSYKGVKHPIIVIHGFEFKKERQMGQKGIWCCKQKDRYKCRARAITYNHIVEMRRFSHNHGPSFKGDLSLCRQQTVTFAHPLKGPIKENPDWEIYQHML
nr:unnamed protein product [Callosobruchus chinensis]